eukprot:Pgem_evm1s381
MVKILFVITSHNKLGDTGKPTGVWYEEFAAPYYVFTEAGHEVSFCSVNGGEPPVDPGSKADSFLTEYTKKFEDDSVAKTKFSSSMKLDDISGDEYQALFYPGGHGPMYDLTNNKTSVALIDAFLDAGKPVGTVCHGPAVLVNTKAVK